MSSSQQANNGDDSGEKLESGEEAQVSIPPSMHRRAQKVLAEIDTLVNGNDG